VHIYGNNKVVKNQFSRRRIKYVSVQLIGLLKTLIEVYHLFV